MKLGIVGLPNVGKSTLFNSLTKAGAESANYPFCTIDPNVGVVTVPDKRLDVLGEMYHTKKIIPAAIEFVDIAGLVKGASKGEGLGNQFLANIREVDAIVHVVRCFENTNIVHVDGSIDPLRDIETINLELIFSDLEVLERRISKTVKLSRNDKMAAKELDLQNRLKAHLEENKMAKSFVTEDEDEQAWLAEYNLLTAKPVIFAANVSEDDITLLSIYLAETFSRISQKFYHWTEHTGTRFTQFYSENESDLQNVFFIELVRNTLQTKLPTLLNSIAESLNINQHIESKRFFAKKIKSSAYLTALRPVALISLSIFRITELCVNEQLSKSTSSPLQLSFNLFGINLFAKVILSLLIVCSFIICYFLIFSFHLKYFRLD